LDTLVFGIDAHDFGTGYASNCWTESLPAYRSTGPPLAQTKCLILCCVRSGGVYLAEVQKHCWDANSELHD